MSLFSELERRNVIRVGAAYAVASWLFIQVAETIFPLFGFGDTPARIVVVILAIGFVPVIIFAWVFELTPDGLKKEKNVDRSESVTPRTAKRLDQTIITVLAVAVAYFAFDKFVLGEIRQATIEEQARQSGRAEALVQSYGDRSIAVLPFIDLSIEQDQEYMSDGIAEELLILLAKIPELRVTSRSSAFSYKGTNARLSVIAEALNVAHILEGSVRKAGDNIRITVQLIEARSDTHLWSTTYDRTLDDIFTIQDEIAAAVVKELKITLLGGARNSYKTEPEAYILFLQARHVASQLTADSTEQAKALYKQVLDIDPNFAEAWAGLARNYANQVNYGFMSLDEGIQAARHAAESAIASDPGLAHAHVSRAIVALDFDSNLGAAARHMERALALDPFDTTVINAGAKMLRLLGRSDEAVIAQQFVVSRDPVNPVRHYNLGLYYLDTGRWDDAIRSFRKSLQLSPSMTGAYFELGTALLCRGEPQAALDAYEQELDKSLKVKGLALALFALDQHAEHASKLNEFIGQWGNEWPVDVASVYAFAGDTDAAFLWLDKAIKKDARIAEDTKACFFSRIRADVRWNNVLRKIGQAPEQLNAIKLNVELPNRFESVSP